MTAPHDRPERHLGRTIVGNLDVANPIEFSQFLLLGRKTGSLNLVSGEHHGVLHFVNGEVVSAVGPDLRGGLEVAMKILKWDDGRFQFVEEPVAPSNEIEIGTQNLLLETARLMDEAQADGVVQQLKKVDELSKTFAAITAQVMSDGDGGGGAAAWIVEQPGRVVFRVPGHPAYGQLPSGELCRFDHDDAFRPSMLQSVGGGPAASGGWVSFRKHRLYLSDGPDGARLVHPYPAPPIDRHLESTGVLETILSAAPSAAVFGPARSGKSLLVALAARHLASEGWRILYLTGMPTHDLADGATIHHEVRSVNGDLTRAHAALRRWRPDVVAIDLAPTDDLAGFVEEAKLSGARLLITARAADEAQARRVIETVVGSTDGFSLVAPWPVAEGPRLELTHAAA